MVYTMKTSQAIIPVRMALLPNILKTVSGSIMRLMTAFNHYESFKSFMVYNALICNDEDSPWLKL
jgi:hypothetical protein